MAYALEPGLASSGQDSQDVGNVQCNRNSTDSPGPSAHDMGLAYDTHFTFRAIVVGLLIGILLCFCNIYFGLQTGWGNGLSIPASLMGFAVFKALSRRLRFPFTPVENVLVQTVAGAVGTMPLGSGFTGIMPAIEFLLDKSEQSPVDLNLWRLLVWSLGISLFGVIFAVPLRREVIVRERLKFPTGTATAVMIGVLHGKVKQERTNAPRSHEDDESHELLLDDSGSVRSLANEGGSSPDQEVAIKASAYARTGIRILSQSFGVSGFYTFVAYFVPQLRDLPIFGRNLARNWLWTLNPSPAYAGQGIIMGPATAFPMLFGAVIGWGILSPLAKRKGWAPGPINDWAEGGRGWIAWIALVIMLTDALINLFWFIVKSILRFVPGLMSRLTTLCSQWLPPSLWVPNRVGDQNYVPILHRTSSASVLPSSPQPFESSDNMREDAPSEHLVSNRAAAIMFALSLLVCLVSMQISFGSIIAPQHSVLAVFIAVLLSIMGVRAVGETDINPASGISKFTQLIFAFSTSRDLPHRVLVNLIAGQVADSGAGQAGDMMQDLKTGHLLKASPKAQYFGAIIGSIFGAFISPIIYKMYTAVYQMPSTLFPMPQAYVWVFAARLVTGRGLPPKVGIFAICASIMFTISTILRIYLGIHPSPDVRKWQPFVPSGIAVAIGMYNPPSFTLARAIGGLFSLWWTHYRRLDETKITVLASGLVLGEGIISIVNLMLAFVDVPHL